MADIKNQKRGILLIATDIIRDIVEGNTDIISDIEGRLDSSDVVLVKSVVSAALKGAEATVDGLHALARLFIMTSEIQNFSDVPNEYYEKQQRYGKVTDDAILSSLVGRIGEGHLLNTFYGLWNANIVPKALDVAVIAALESVREGDPIYIDTFAELIDIIFISRVDEPIETRLSWVMTEEYAGELRAKIAKIDG
jgi:hypothetical protein